MTVVKEDSMGSQPPRRKRGLLAKLLVSTSVLVLGVIGYEAYYRYHNYGLAGFSPTLMRSFRLMGDSGLIRASEYPDLRIQLRPNLRARFKFAVFNTNSQGLRDEEYSLEKPEGTFRIAFVGDSYTMRSGVEIEDVYHSVLETSLNRDASGVRYECINFGVGSFGLLDYFGTIKDRVLAYSPDLIVIGLTSTDDVPPPDGYLETPFVKRPDIAPSFLRLTFVQRLLEEHPPNETPREERTEYQREMLGRIRGVVPRETGLFCVFLSTNFVDRERRSTARFERLAKSFDIGYLDTTVLFEGKDSLDYQILPIDRHPNVAGHAIYAEALEKALRDGGWLKPRR